LGHAAVAVVGLYARWISLRFKIGYLPLSLRFV
jgi:hypothetical protein